MNNQKLEFLKLGQYKKYGMFRDKSDKRCVGSVPENDKTLLRNIGKDIIKWRDILSSWSG